MNDAFKLWAKVHKYYLKNVFFIVQNGSFQSVIIITDAFMYKQHSNRNFVCKIWNQKIQIKAIIWFRRVRDGNTAHWGVKVGFERQHFFTEIDPL